jgi:hypothetical protein
MKHALFLALTLVGLVGCNSEPKTSTPATPDQEMVARNFLEDLETLNHADDPINAFKAGAESIADEAFDLDGENAKLMMTKVQDYSKTVIVVEDHTIVLTTNQDECRESGSWKACMPFARGFIKKGDLMFQEDFANNIIGIPDDQQRRVYFFSE